jgi:hypothetical protein
MTPFGGLRFTRDAAVYEIGAGGRSQVLDLTEAQQFSSGLIAARTPTNIEQAAFRTARERLTIERDGAGFRVVNGLGATVRKLAFRSGGQVYTLDAPLADGATATMRRGSVAPYAMVPVDVLRAGRFMKLVEAQPEGAYLAVLDRSPFWEPGTRGLVERDSFHFVLGWPDGQP